VSDDSPQRGWDNWFDAEQDSPGGEQQASEQQVPPTAPPESEPETEAEQTSWTMPAIGAAPEAESSTNAEPPEQAPEPEPPQVQQPKPQQQEAPADDAAPTQHIAAVADNQATQYVQAKPPAAQGTWQPEPAQARDPAPAANPWADAQPTTQLPQAPQGSQGQQAPQSQAPQQPPSSEQPTQVWTAAPAAQQPNAPAQQPQSQPPQDPYAATTQQPAQPQQPPAYSAPPQGPPSSGYPGYQQQTGWDEQPERRGPGAASPVVTPAAAVPAPKQPQPNSRRKIFISSGVGAVVIVALATVLVMNNGSLTGSSHSLAAPTGFQPTGTSVAGDAEQTADAFLAAWQSGDFKQAATYTDAPGAAQSMLSSYDSGLNLHGLQLTATGSSVVTPAPSNAASDSSPSGTTSSASAAPSVPSSTAGVVSFNVVAKVGVPATSSSSTSSAGASASASASVSGSSSSSSTASGSAAASSVTANWTYSSKLTAYKKNGGWWVQWVPSLVAPNLTASEKLVSSAIAPSAAEVEDSTGADLSSATDPGVHNIYLALKKNAPAGEGTPGVQIELATANGTPIANTADVLSQPVNTGVVKTTINPTDEAAAQQAVLKYAASSMVVIQPSTGDILAVANNDGDNDFALTAAIAPGSTDKIITSTALLTSGLVSSPSQQVVCPKQITVNGTVFNNSESESEPANTPFLDDFAISCNNAFGQWYTQIGATTLADTAEKYYGLNQAWDIGTGESATYYTIPSSASNGELFQELFGQGQLETAPIAMASVAATVDSGTFKQPVVVPGASQVTATSLPTNVQQDLWQMMHAVVTQSDGTAYGVFNGVNSTVYGKTGTADVGSTQDKPNSWMVVFDPTLDVAIGCVVLDAGYGASYAGPETAAALEGMQ
jgi:Penicillin binding protein transpeptidase domain